MYYNGVIQSCGLNFFFSSRRRHTRFKCDWSSDVCSSDLVRSDDGVQFAARDIKRDVIGREDATEPPDQIFNAEQGFSHGAASPAALRCRRARTARSAVKAGP